ncbi:MAG: DUF2877 domain-containing protein [Jatrophihabitans sp.]
MQGHSVAIRQIASVTDFVHQQLLSYSGPVPVLGAFPTALYLQLPTDAVIALLSSDAVLLPIGLALPVSSRRLPLDRALDGTGGAAWLQAGELAVAGLRVTAGSLRSQRLAPVGRPVPGQLLRHRAVRDAALALTGLTGLQLAALTTDPAAGVADLLGRGPGLTPAGDDLLCGLLAGSALFGSAPFGSAPFGSALFGSAPFEPAPFEPVADRVRLAVLEQLASRPRATTSLSRQLLRCAAAGEGIAQLQAFGSALCRPGTGASAAAAWAELVAIGHSSGTALGLGLLMAAEQAVGGLASSAAADERSVV